jgi:hypothetical protein
MTKVYFQELTELELTIVVALAAEYGLSEFRPDAFRAIKKRCVDMLGLGTKDDTSIRAKGYMSNTENRLVPEALEFLQGAYHEHYNKSSTV